MTPSDAGRDVQSDNFALALSATQARALHDFNAGVQQVLEAGALDAVQQLVQQVVVDKQQVQLGVDDKERMRMQHTVGGGCFGNVVWALWSRARSCK